MADPNQATDITEFVAQVEAQHAAAAEAAKREAEANERLTRTYGRLATDVGRAEKSAAALGRSLRDGSAVRAARDIERLRREEDRYRREVTLRSRFGDRVGGFVARHERGLGYAEYAASKAAGAAGSLYRRGMSGTVEQGRREVELNLLGREVASIFKPVSDVTTDLIRGFRKLLGGLGESGQNALMVGGLGVAGALGVAGLARGGGLGRLALGGGAAAGLAGGLDLGTIAGGAVGLKMLGGLRGGGGAGASGLADAMRSKWTAGTAAPRTLGGTIARVGGAVALAGASAYEGATGGYWDVMRARGHNMATSAAASLGGGFMDIISRGTKALGITEKTYGEAFRERYSTADPHGNKFKEADSATRRSVMAQGGGFQELGRGYDDIAERFGLVADAPKKTADATADMAVRMKNMEAMMASAVGGGVITPVERGGS